MINKPDDTAELLAFAVLDDNKRLIAERDRLRAVNAELLAAVKHLSDVADGIYVRFTESERKELSDAWGAVNAAIAKATAGAV